MIPIISSRDGLELAVRFSYITNSLQFCGPRTAHEIFGHYLEKKDNAPQVRDALLRFEGLNPYLTAIAQKHNLDTFDYKVVEAYWIGNELLDSFTDEDMKNIIRKLMTRGLPKSIGTNLIAHLPVGCVPHHNFNVFYVGVGRTTGSVETTLHNMDNCRISWGTVAGNFEGHLIVTVPKLRKINGKYLLGEPETKTAVFLKAMLPDIIDGDTIALHWGFAAHPLEQHQIENLRKYTQKIFRLF